MLTNGMYDLGYRYINLDGKNVALSLLSSHLDPHRLLGESISCSERVNRPFQFF
jgi:hypothetical protein